MPVLATLTTWRNRAEYAYVAGRQISNRKKEGEGGGACWYHLALPDKFWEEQVGMRKDRKITGKSQEKFPSANIPQIFELVM